MAGLQTRHAEGLGFILRQKLQRWDTARDADCQTDTSATHTRSAGLAPLTSPLLTSNSRYVHVGEKRSFSEQQLIDCSYDWTNVGCDGGDSKPAINYVASAGGIAIEQDYYYHSTGDFCRRAQGLRGGPRGRVCACVRQA